MKRSELEFARPEELVATAPCEARGIGRDDVRLLVSTPGGHEQARFSDLPRFLTAGDLLVVNQSATLPASLPAVGRPGAFLLNLSTHYGGGLWLAEPRWSPAQPGPLPLEPGDVVDVGPARVTLIRPYPGLPRLWFVHSHADLHSVMRHIGKPIRYGYVAEEQPMEAYQTVFAAVPGSAEMPSAGYPFTRRLVRDLQRGGVAIAPIVLHTGVSSLEVETDEVEQHPLYPEPFVVPAPTAAAIQRARREGRRVIAVGTTVVRALESAWDGEKVRAACGFTRIYVHPGRGIHTVDGLITGMHDPVTSHLAMLYAVAGPAVVRSAYEEAVAAGFLWHEFGDSHLILRDEPASSIGETRQFAVA